MYFFPHNCNCVTVICILSPICCMFAIVRIVTNSNLIVQFVQTLMSSRALKLSSQSLGRDSSMSSTDRPLRRSLRAMQLTWTRQGYKLTKKKRDASDKLIHDFTWKKKTKQSARQRYICDKTISVVCYTFTFACNIKDKTLTDLDIEDLRDMGQCYWAKEIMYTLKKCVLTLPWLSYSPNVAS